MVNGWGCPGMGVQTSSQHLHRMRLNIKIDELIHSKVLDARGCCKADLAYIALRPKHIFLRCCSRYGPGALTVPATAPQ